MKNSRIQELKNLSLGWLVMAAALTFSACSSENDLVEETKTIEEPAETATKIHVTVGAGISDGEAATRSLVVKDGTKRWLTFTLPEGTKGQPGYSPGDRLYIWGRIESDVRTMGGMLTIKSVSEDGKSATFGGDLTVWKNSGNWNWSVDTEWAATQEGDPMTWYGTNDITGMLIPAATADDAPIYTFHNDGHFDFNHDKSLVTGDGDLVNKMMESAIEVNGSYDKTKGCFNLECIDAILNCTFSGLAKTTSYKISIWKEDDEIRPYEQSVTTDGNGTARFAISNNMFGGDDDHFIKLSPNDDSGLLSCNLGNKEFIPKVYNVKRNWTGTAFVAPQTINLSSVSGDVTLRNGDELKGELSGYHKISIAPGATVTLSGATIPGLTHGNWNSNYTWAGITCLGDATIVLADGTENYAKGYHCEYPGIQAGPAGTTLTIRGTGTLTAETGMGTNQGYAAGIGGGYEETVGNIRIEGGNITARGNMGGAGIGSGMNLVRNLNMGCGDITIIGGTVTAMGGTGAAGIGSGFNSNNNNANTCGDITIGGTATGTARGGLDSPNDIGAGKDGSCGEVSVAAGTISYTYYTVACTLKVTIIEDNGQLVSNKTCDNITISDGTRSVTLSGDNLRFDNLTKVATLNFSLRGPQTGATLTVTGTGGSLQSDTYSATKTVDITGASCDLGTVNLVKQQ